MLFESFATFVKSNGFNQFLCFYLLALALSKNSNNEVMSKSLKTHTQDFLLLIFLWFLCTFKPLPFGTCITLGDC